VSPRAADDDGVIQRETPGKKSADRVCLLSARFRTQTAILHYKVRFSRQEIERQRPKPHFNGI